MQTKKDRYSPDEGTGLGLTISKRYVELMGGNIHIVSSVNQGTTVDFDILVTTSLPQNNENLNILRVNIIERNVLSTAQQTMCQHNFRYLCPK